MLRSICFYERDNSEFGRFIEIPFSFTLLLEEWYYTSNHKLDSKSKKLETDYYVPSELVNNTAKRLTKMVISMASCSCWFTKQFYSD